MINVPLEVNPRIITLTWFCRSVEVAVAVKVRP